MNFGSRLKLLRKEHGLTQSELAQKINLSKPNVSKYEADIIEPNLETLSYFASLFDVTTDYLLCRTDDPSVPSAEHRLFGLDFTINKETKDLTDKEKETVLDFIKFTKSQRFRHSGSESYIAATGGHVSVPGSEETPESARKIIDKTFDDEE